MKNKWIEIFKTGTHTDSNGNEKTWTEADLDNIVAKYNPQFGAPIVIGHPKDNAPAYGWVEGLKRVGEMLFYKPMQVIDEFQEMVNKGLFKKRSISLYPDGTLRHIGYLGAMPPAIKGLADHTFMAEGDSATYEFCDNYKMNSIGNIFQRLREWIIEKYGADTADRVIGNWEIEDLKRQMDEPSQTPLYKETNRKEEGNMKIFDFLKKKAADEGVTLDDVPTTFSEQDMERKVTEAVKVKETELIASFSEKEAALKKKEDALKTEAAATKKKAIADFCEGLKKQGKLIPAMDKLGMGITEFMSQISTIESTIEFGEGDDKKKQTPLEFMQSFLTALPKMIKFGEVAKRGTDPGAGNAAEKLTALTTKKRQEKKDLSYSEAFNEVQIENPELAAEYAEGLQG